MKKQKSSAVPILRIKKGDSLKTIYAKAKRAFTAADLAKYAVEEEGIPVRQILAELEDLDRQYRLKRQAKAKNVRTR